MNQLKSLIREEPLPKKYEDIRCFSLADFCLFEIYYCGHSDPGGMIILREDASLLAEVKKKLHVDPGINPFNKQKTARLQTIRIGKPVFKGPFCWKKPGLEEEDSSGAYVLGWTSFETIYGPKINKPKPRVIAPSPYDPAVIKISDLRTIDINLANGNYMSRMVHRNDLIKFLNAQTYLSFKPALAMDPDHDGFVGQTGAVSSLPDIVYYIWVHEPDFWGPYWHESPDFKNYSPKGVCHIFWGKTRTVFDSKECVCC